MREDELRAALDSFADPHVRPPSPAGLRARAGRRRLVRGGVAALAVVTVGGVALTISGNPATTAGVPQHSASPSAAAVPTPSASVRAPRTVAADPNLDLRCRREPNQSESFVWNKLPINSANTSPLFVDVADGISIVGYWSETSGQLETSVWSQGTASPTLPRPWDGTVPTSGDSLADGPAAQEAVLACFEAIVNPPEQQRPTMKCETPTRDDLLRVQKSLWGGRANPTGGGMYVRGATTPEGKPWLIYAINTEIGVQTVLVQLPSPQYKGGSQGRSEFSPLSDNWDGQLAEFRGHVQWGVEVQQAAFACLGD